VFAAKFVDNIFGGLHLGWLNDFREVLHVQQN
jgi:hypothetical protein